MNLDDMFPSKYLPASELPNLNAEPNAVTIEGLTSELVKNRQTRQEETLWLMKLLEFERPMKLKTINARKIAQILGSEDTSHWIGRRINIYATKTEVAGEVYDVIRVHDYVPQDAPAPTRDMTRLGDAGAEKLIERFKTNDKGWDAFVGMLRAKDIDAFTAVGGREPADVPRWVIHQYVQGFEIPPDIDRETGEVRDHEPASPNTHAGPPHDPDHDF